MKESTFRQAVQSKVPKKVHRQPIPQGMQSTAGTPDSYFDYISDLWVEWKSLPGEDFFPLNLKGKYQPTVKQCEWMNRRHAAGGNVIAIVGFKIKGRVCGVVLNTPELWGKPVPEKIYRDLMLTAQQLADYIEKRVSE